MVVTQAMIDRLARDGLKMRHYLVHAGQTIQCTIGADDDLSVTYLTADLRDVQRVDVVSYVDGKEWSRIDDAPIDRDTGQVIYTVGAASLVRSVRSRSASSLWPSSETGPRERSAATSSSTHPIRAEQGTGTHSQRHRSAADEDCALGVQGHGDAARSRARTS